MPELRPFVDGRDRLFPDGPTSLARYASENSGWRTRQSVGLTRWLVLQRVRSFGFFSPRRKIAKNLDGGAGKWGHSGSEKRASSVVA